jgi:outer membrane protein OmpA-like peptidoglycan-associated protein
MRLLITALLGFSLISLLIPAAKAQPYGGYFPTSTYDPPYASAGVTVVYPPPVSVPPPVIVAPRQITYFIAFTDSMVRLADEYWVSGATLHYVTPDHQLKTAPLATVDRTVSARLNMEQHVSFSLPSHPAEAELALLLEKLSPILATRSTSRGLIVGMSDLLFDFNQATLTPVAREKLSGIAGVLAGHSLSLRLQGYTDNIGSDEHNLQLSRRRADSVRGYLVSQGVPAANVTAAGFGSASPIASNATATGRQQNRRVELLISGDTSGIAASALPD